MTPTDAVEHGVGHGVVGGHGVAAGHGGFVVVSFISAVTGFSLTASPLQLFALQ